MLLQSPDLRKQTVMCLNFWPVQVSLTFCCIMLGHTIAKDQNFSVMAQTSCQRELVNI